MIKLLRVINFFFGTSTAIRYVMWLDDRQMCKHLNISMREYKALLKERYGE